MSKIHKYMIKLETGVLTAVFGMSCNILFPPSTLFPLNSEKIKVSVNWISIVVASIAGLLSQYLEIKKNNQVVEPSFYSTQIINS